MLTRSFAVMLMLATIAAAYEWNQLITTTIAPGSYYYWSVDKSCEKFSAASYCSPLNCDFLVFSPQNFQLFQRDGNSSAIDKSVKQMRHTYSANAELISKYGGIVIVVRNPNPTSSIRLELNINQLFSNSNIMILYIALPIGFLCCCCALCILGCCVYGCSSKSTSRQSFSYTRDSYSRAPKQNYHTSELPPITNPQQQQYHQYSYSSPVVTSSSYTPQSNPQMVQPSAPPAPTVYSQVM